MVKKKNMQNYIVVNFNNSEDIINFLKTKTDLPIYDIQQGSIWSFDQKYLDKRPISYRLTSFYDYEEKFFIAESFLRLYENAQCVITDKVHCALPCLGLKTPVLFFNTASYQPERMLGLDKLLIQSNFEEYKENYEIFDVENPPKNPKNYLNIRKDLISKTKKFTGFKKEFYDSNYSSDEMINKQTELLAKTAKETKNYMRRVIKLSNEYESRLKE